MSKIKVGQQFVSEFKLAPKDGGFSLEALKSGHFKMDPIPRDIGIENGVKTVRY